ncbi:hypothetical protein [Micromonospora pisi]|uniref:hypothetical protein n=1 Tax=Micromonospora pisi TaxID=589240 RepID=UPI001B8822B2|nr:hypothetical protein [Micromonospora pisi]
MITSFRHIVTRVGEALEAQFPGVNYEEIEPDLRSLVAVVTGHPRHTADFEEEFISLLQSDNPGKTEILQYSMHLLRWPSVRAATENLLLVSDDPRAARTFERILEAFEPDWEDRDLFADFRS